jgi:tyrosyl-tRNA synthetase
MRVPDEVMPRYYSLLLDERFDPGWPAVESKRHLARSICATYHGEEAARRAEERFDRLHVERAMPPADEIDEVELPDAGEVHLPALIREHFGVSASEARRLIAQGGVRVDGATLADGDLDLPAERLDGVVIQLGKRQFKRLRRPMRG